MHELTPESWARIQPVMMVRVEKSRARQRVAEEAAEVIERLIERLQP
jgi:hypothetical protein